MLDKCQIHKISAKFIKWSNTLKQFVGNLPTNCLNVFGHFSGLALNMTHKDDDSQNRTRPDAVLKDDNQFTVIELTCPYKTNA